MENYKKFIKIDKKKKKIINLLLKVDLDKKGGKL